MTIKRVLSEGRAPVKIWTDDVDATTEAQLRNLATLPFIHKHVAVMPDCHAGIGSTVGTVIPTKKAIIPAAVGVDIGCGMMAQRLPISAGMLPDSLAVMCSAIEAAVPHGRTDNGGLNDRGAWGEVPEFIGSIYAGLDDDAVTLRAKHPKLERALDRGHRQLGTLSTGNHFVEVCLDKQDQVWVMLHSGSRGVGNAIGRYFIEKAKEEMERYSIELADKDLAYLPEGSPLFNDYWKAVAWAQDYARINRELMMKATLWAVEQELDGGFAFGFEETAVNCHHNYVTLENHFGENVYVTRKGAVRAREGDLGIIPGSMGARSFIVRGKGNPESFDSCSHGAGRRMSRGEAKRMFTVEDLEMQTAGVECRKDADVIDEIPACYKDIDTVMANQSDLVEVVAELKQVLCVKG